MDLIGVIEAVSDQSTISMSRWCEVVEAHAALARPEPRVGVNPFTRKPSIFQPSQGSATVVADGRRVGSMAWSESRTSEVNVFDEPSVVTPIAEEVAGMLGGRFEARNA
jgi:hypothetical protein